MGFSGLWRPPTCSSSSTLDKQSSSFTETANSTGDIHMKTVYTSGQLVKLTETLEQHGVVPETFQNGFSTGLTADYFEAVGKAELIKVSREEFRRVLGLGPLIPEPDHLVIDYSQTLEQMILAGRYDWKNDNITADRFPVRDEGIVEYEYKLVHPNRSISSKDVIKETTSIDKENPWQVARIEHLLAYGAKNPEEQRKYPIVALGSVGEVGDDRGVPFLGEGGSRRLLSLRWFDFVWYSVCRFLAVRKITRA